MNSNYSPTVVLARNDRVEAPRVSVIVLFYNHAHFIAECLQSIIAQTFEDFEIVVIEDGSTDDGLNVAIEAASSFPRIKILTQENRGAYQVASTLNSALEYCTGDLIAICSGDDYWPKSKLEEQVALHNEDVIFSFGSVSIVDDGQTTRTRVIDESISAEAQFVKYLLRRDQGAVPSSVMVRRDAITSIGGFQGAGMPMEDYPTYMALSLLPGRIVASSKELAFWRKHPTQASQTRLVEIKESGMALALEMYAKHRLRLPPEITREAVYRAQIRQVEWAHLVAARSAMERGDLRAVTQHSNKLRRSRRLGYFVQGYINIGLAALRLNPRHIYKVYDKLHDLVYNSGSR